jgi:YidC/Oxa1 family membrane protein insertase
MSNEKRLIVFTVVAFASILVLQYVMEVTGLVPPPPPPAKQAPLQAGKAKPGADKDKDKAIAKGEPPAKPGETTADAATPKGEAPLGEAGKAKPKAKEPAIKLAEPAELVLGSLKKTGPDGYRLEARFEQKGAGVSSLFSTLYEAEFVEGQKKHRPLELLKYDPLVPPSLAMTLVTPRDAGVDPAAAAAAGMDLDRTGGGELPLDLIVWEIVRDGDGHAVRAVSKPRGAVAGEKNPAKLAPVEGQEIVFRTKVDELGLTITKTYRLFKGEDGFEVDLSFASPEKPHSIVYKILGPHGIPIEGEWYTGTFRDAIFGMVDGSTTNVKTISAYDIVKKKGNPDRFQTQPMKFVGVENQYFAAVFGPTPPPRTSEERWDAETVPIILHEDPESQQKSDIAVEVMSKPVPVGPNQPVTHSYRVFAGPKTVEALAPFGAEDLAGYRKSNWIPLAPFFARAIITPLLAATYELTRLVAGFFGGKTGNYGVAIILMTMIVRLAMFPLGRKQALAAKKMQDLQPYLKEMQEKFKDDKEAQTKETWALYKRHGVNPVSGCLPALIQLPIFVGLWQALNNSVSLRHANFLWIENLAAPDMLLKFPTTLPLLGDYLNVLPFVVVALMLVQTKLFSPPATTPEAEQQQKMMKIMMIFMAFMFYKVPSGLGLYFITSSLWQISERLLLPKVSATAKAQPLADDDLPGNGPRGKPLVEPPAKPPGKLATFWAKLLDEAQKNPTYRNLTDDLNRPSGGSNGSRDGNSRDKGKPRTRPGRRR